MDEVKDGDASSRKDSTTAASASKRELVVTRTVEAPPRRVFDAWTRAELFRQWWVPKSMNLALLSCDMDVRVGGTYRLVFDAAPEPMVFHGTYLDVTPPTRLAWTNEETHGSGQVTTVTFEERAGRTSIVVRETYPSKAVLDAAIAAGSTGGDMVETFDQLDDLLAAQRASANGA